MTNMLNAFLQKAPAAKLIYIHLFQRALFLIHYNFCQVTSSTCHIVKWCESGGRNMHHVIHVQTSALT